MYSSDSIIVIIVLYLVDNFGMFNYYGLLYANACVNEVILSCVLLLCMRCILRRAVSYRYFDVDTAGLLIRFYHQLVE